MRLTLLANELAGARAAGAAEAAIAGGVTPSVVQMIRSSLGDGAISGQSVIVTGTSGPVPWGNPVTVTAQLPVHLSGFPYSVLGLQGQTILIGGSTTVTSNWIPPGSS